MKVVGLFSVALLAVISTSQAQETEVYPRRAITMIVPFAAGGPTDVTARIVAIHMSRTLGQPVVVENVVGDAGHRAVLQTARAKPDGYTVLMGHMGTHGAAPALYPNLKYDPVADFTAIGLVAGTPIVIVANKRVPVHDVKSFVEYARARGPQLKMAHAGIGSVSHTTGILLTSVLGFDPTMAVYGGTGPALNDLVAGKVDIMTDQIVNVAPKIEAGLIRALAIATDERSSALPDVPTTREVGLGQYVVSAWNALFAPVATPTEVAAKLNFAIGGALEDDITRRRLMDLGAVIPDRKARTQEALRKLVQEEVLRWKSIMETHGSAGGGL